MSMGAASRGIGLRQVCTSRPDGVGAGFGLRGLYGMPVSSGVEEDDALEQRSSRVNLQSNGSAVWL